MPHVPSNIERFNLTAVRLFDELYDAFPVAIDIDTAMLGAEAAPENLDGPGVLNYAMQANEVVTWLAEEGFIRVAGASLGTELHGVRLTLKGLTVLGYLPASLKKNDPPEPMITKIKRALASGAEKAGSDAVKSLITGVFQLALRAAISSTGAGDAGTGISA